VSWVAVMGSHHTTVNGNHFSKMYATKISPIENFKKLESAGLLDGKIQVYKQGFCNVNIIPINKLVMKLYDPIAQINKENWNLTI
jgi:hypothetical protein